MTTKRRQIVERPSGIGKIFKDHQEIAKASYLLDMLQTMNIARTFTETTEIPGIKDVRGRLKVLDGQANLMGDKFVLALADGRRWEFIATKGDPVTGGYTVVMSGDSF